jgi:hypothetical protein
LRTIGYVAISGAPVRLSPNESIHFAISGAPLISCKTGNIYRRAVSSRRISPARRVRVIPHAIAAQD